MDHAWALFYTAAALGFRHGIDWDHLAAISDIVGTAEDKKAVPQAMAYASLYALGHATAVALLGLAALNCMVLLPA